MTANGSDEARPSLIVMAIIGILLAAVSLAFNAGIQSLQPGDIAGQGTFEQSSVFHADTVPSDTGAWL